jgi:serine/threonine protein kinase
MVIKIFSQLVVAVSLFHTNNLAHFDLKPANIFIDEDVNAVLGIGVVNKKFFIKIFFFFNNYGFFFVSGDFGESRYFIPSDDAGTISALGTMLYMSPEMVRNEKFV